MFWKNWQTWWTCVITTRDELSVSGLGMGISDKDTLLNPGYRKYWETWSGNSHTALPYPRRKKFKNGNQWKVL